MAQVNKIDSNVTGLRIAEEETPGVLPTTPDWIPHEPNSYADFGGEITTIARNPINPDRQRKKGVVTDLNAVGGFQSDLTQTNMQSILQGYLLADLRPKGEEIVTGVVTTDTYEMADTTGFVVGYLVEGQNFDDAANNVLGEITAVVPATSVTVDQLLVNDAAPAADARLVVVGVAGAAGDIDVDAAGTLPTLTSTVLDFTTLGLIPGEWIHVGGDAALSFFPTNAENNGFKRIRSIEATILTFDKSDSAMITEASAADVIRLFFGRVLKNETGTLIVKRTYQQERTLGAPDDTLPAEIQAEYVEGGAPSEFTINLASADKVTVDLNFLGEDHTQVDGPTALKTGNRPDVEEADAFNTSSDFSRIRMAEIVAGEEAPTPLFAFAQELTLIINNNVQQNKALGVLGSCGTTFGTFEVGGSLTAYFSNISAIQAVRNNADITLDFILVKANSGIVVDVPLITLGDGKANVEQDQPILLPLTSEAATAAKIDTALNHTLLMVFFDYLPDLADL